MFAFLKFLLSLFSCSYLSDHQHTMTTKIRISDNVLRLFPGESNVVAWIRLMAKLQDTENVAYAIEFRRQCTESLLKNGQL